MIQYTKDIFVKIFGDPALAGLIGLFGILLSVWGIYRALRGRRISFRRIDIPFFKSSLENSKLSQIFTEQTETISCAEIAIWNSGRKYINNKMCHTCRDFFHPLPPACFVNSYLFTRN